MNVLNQKITLKRIMTFVLLIMSVLLISACSNKNQNPTGNINNDPFITIGEHEVTNLELYNALKPNSTSILRQLITEELFKEELEAIDLNDVDQLKYLEKTINTAIFGVTTVESIVEMNASQRARSILSFADSLAISEASIKKDELLAFLEDRLTKWTNDFANDDIDTEEDYIFGYAANTPLVDAYKVSLAQYNYAKEILLVDVLDEDSDSYIEESDLVTYFRNNLEGRHDVSALIVIFNSTAEHQLARYNYQVKPNSRGEWFQLPDVFTEAAYNAIKAANPDNASTDGYAYARQLLNDLQVNFDAGYDSYAATVNFTSTTYADFYGKWVLSRNRDTNSEFQLDDNQVLTLFLAINDDLTNSQYTSKVNDDLHVIANTAEFINLGEAANNTEINSAYTMEVLIEEFTLEYTNVLLANNSTLRTEVYDLAANTKEGAEETIIYSRTPNSLGSSTNYFLVYALKSFESDDEILDETDEDNVVFLDTTVAQEMRTKAWDAVFESRLSSTFINNKVTERHEDAEINIYDRIIRTFYSNTYDYDGATSKKDNLTLASVNGNLILVDEFYDEIKQTLGISVALDLILVDELYVRYEDQITATERADMQSQFESTLTQFKNNQFESSGFPASIGMEAFLLLAFNASSNAEAFEKAYIQSKLRQLFQQDYVNHYGANTAESNIYEKWAQLSALQFENYLGVDTSHILIYFDLDFDGNPDDPNKITDFSQFGDPTITDMASLEAKLQELVNIITQRASITPLNSTALNRVISHYGEATRFGHTLDTTDPNVWTEFKRLGIQLKFESLGTITNNSNNPSNSSTYDQAFFAYTMEIAAGLTEFLGDAPTSSQKSSILPLWVPNGITLGTVGDDEPSFNKAFDLDQTRSSFGWHLLLITDVKQTVSAKLELSSGSEPDPARVSDFNNPWTDEPLMAYNSNVTVSAEQIMIYIKESGVETGVESLTTTISNAISNYFTPVKSLYDSDYNQLEISFRLLALLGDSINDEGFLPDLGDATLNSTLSLLREANLGEMFSYGVFFTTNTTSFHDQAEVENYVKLYGKWFEILTA